MNNKIIIIIFRMSAGNGGIGLKEQILKMLRDKGDYISGQEICDNFGVSRTAVWKGVNRLKEEGYEIESVPGRGYRLISTPDAITASEIQSLNKSRNMGKRIVYFEETDSTNIQAAALAKGNKNDWAGTLVIAESQTFGKGRRGRSWSSPKGSGIWMSLLLKPDMPPDRVSGITLLAALAVHRSLRNICPDGLLIKWPNDLVIDGRKVCGILTEMNAQTDYINYVVIGIGINVNIKSFPEEIKNVAVSLSEITGNRIKRAPIAADFLYEFEKLYEQFLKEQNLSFMLEEYHRCLANKDEKVKVLSLGSEWEGTARGVNERGELLVENNQGEIAAVMSGEVSVRGIYGYI